MACITWSTKLEASSLCTVTKEQHLQSPVRGAQLLKLPRPPQQSFLLAAPLAQIMMRYRGYETTLCSCLHHMDKQVVFTQFFFAWFLLEQEAISYSEERSRVLPNNCCQAFWFRTHQVSAVPLGEHSGTIEDGGEWKSPHWYVDLLCLPVADTFSVSDRHR